MSTSLLPASDALWEAVATRDRNWDGRLYYGVTSTRVYCRPSCPSRRPRRDRTRFFDTPDAAEMAGFRACRRCQPRAQEGPRQGEAIETARRWIDEHPDDRVRLDTLARVAGVSSWHLQRTFKKVVGLSPREYAAARRRARFRTELRSSTAVSRASFEAGFGSSSRVYEQTNRMLGMTPGAYRRGGRGMEIRYTIVASPFGRLLVAATERGVCAVAPGDQDARLERELRAEFPEAAISRVREGDDWLRDLVTRVAGEIQHPGSDTDIPLDVRGTAFQWRVWEALTCIPAGETRTYTELARALGTPRAVRAVASACAANRLAVLVPCHRVIRADGSLGGYRWGLPRKSALLDREAHAPS
jgi:AraC family transcriptional regulator of adaptative response/methylated-DNA-[protein]-cysteine methyltransferase